MGVKVSILPKYARYLLDNFLTEICREQFQLSQLHQLPLLKYLSGYSEEQIIAIAKESMIEFLTNLENETSKEFITLNLERWVKDQLDVIGKFEIESNDITLVSYIRATSIKSFIPRYTGDVAVIMQLVDEIDTFFYESNSRSVDTYVQILRERLTRETTFNARLTDALPGRVFIYDLQTQQEVYSSAKQKIGEVETAQQDAGINTDSFKSLIHPADRHVAGIVQSLFKADDKDEVRSFEYRIRNNEDEYNWIRNYVMVYTFGDDQMPTQIIGIAFDVTDEKALMHMLKHREAQLLEAQDIAHIGSYEWNMVDKTSKNTPEIYKIFGMTEGTHFESFMNQIHPDDKEKVQSAIASSFKTGMFECEYRYMSPSGEKVIWSKGRVTIKDGVPQKMLGTVQDITERKRIENDLLHKSILLERSNDDLKHFASIASHDLKEPLRKIAILTDSLLSNDTQFSPESVHENYVKIKNSAVRMQQMVNDILEYSSISMNEEKKLMPLKNILQEVVDMYDHLIAETGTIINADALPEAVIIPSQMRRLFQNLLANSIKFANKGVSPVINISHTNVNHSSQHKWLEITFSDNGIGFEPQQSELIFDLFSRLNNSRIYPGSGIGLAICKRIAENHSGTITAQGEKGKGATFKISIPG